MIFHLPITRIISVDQVITQYFIKAFLPKIFLVQDLKRVTLKMKIERPISLKKVRT